eukprot:TRINITY_DN560_c0_g4_i1.p1 TRINITY_DN560_c0_g4~~TRINITY_DN560_c0_g4_i1.p1  ORF type:complete len:335 (+),score=151.00 TRINITY_DN560_c0_g4_i1:638-1642(+)
MSEGRFDGVFLSLAQQLQGGIPELMDVYFDFLRRKTDFFTGASNEVAKDLVLKAFNKHGDRAKTEAAEKKKRDDEISRKQKEKREAEAAAQKASENQPRVMEISDEEEARILADQAKKANGVTADSDSKATPPPPAPEKEESDEEEGGTKMSEEDKKAGKVKPNKGNGSQTDKYSWTQTLGELEVRVTLPPGTRGRDLDVVFASEHMKVGLKGKPVLVSGNLHKKLKADETLWNVEDNKGEKVLVVTLTKANQMEWWSALLVGEAEIVTQMIQPENSKLEDLDHETRGVVEKMMFDTRQKQAGLPTSDEMQKQEMLKKFMAQHPEMDFSNAKFS